MSYILPTHPPSGRRSRNPTQKADPRIDLPGQHQWFGVAATDAGAPRRPKPVARNLRRDTNPIARGRVSRFAQSGFNEVAHRAKLDDHRRATSQNPPDSQSGNDLIQRCGMSRYDLTDFEWRVIAPLLPNKPRGVPRVDDRRVLNGIFWVLRSGAPWRDLPERYGPRTTCYNRFVRWRRAGVWDRLMDAITAAYDGDIQMIDSTSVRAHQQAATAKRGVEIIVSVAPGAASRPRSTRSSTGKVFRSGSA